MALKHSGYIDLPEHAQDGGFDHGAVHERSGRLYVAHTANDAVDVIDCATDAYLHSIPDLPGVAGVLVSDQRNLIFTSNRAEGTVAIFSPDDEKGIVKVKTGVRPNGLAYDASNNLLLAAHVGDPEVADSCTVALVDVGQQRVVGDMAAPGRTRWAVYDPWSAAFYVNIMEPACILVVNPRTPTRALRTLPLAVAGPHGLDLDLQRGRLFCACDDKQLLVMDTGGSVRQRMEISGAPDAIFYNADLRHLYIAIGDPGLIDVIDTRAMHLIHSVETEKGAHTIGFDSIRHKVYAFLPGSHRAAVFADEP